MGGEACPYKIGCKYYPTNETSDPHECGHWFGGYGYHIDQSGRHYLRISSAKRLLDRGDPDLVSWILSMARDLYGVTRDGQKDSGWPRRGDRRIGRGQDKDKGFTYWDQKVKDWLPKLWLDERFRKAYWICDQIGDCSAMAGTYVHWYMASRLWADSGFPEQFDPGPPPPQPPAFDAEGTLVDYAATIPARKRQVDEFLTHFHPQLVATEQKYLSQKLGIGGSFDSLLMFPEDSVNMYSWHVRAVARKPWLDLDLARGLVRPFQQQEVVLTDWKTSKATRAETAVQLGLYYLILKDAEDQMEAATGMTLPLPVRLMTVRFFAPQALEAKDQANQPRWEVVEIPLELGVELATEALDEARKLGAIF